MCHIYTQTHTYKHPTLRNIPQIHPTYISHKPQTHTLTHPTHHMYNHSYQTHTINTSFTHHKHYAHIRPHIHRSVRSRPPHPHTTDTHLYTHPILTNTPHIYSHICQPHTTRTHTYSPTHTQISHI